jgi:hypothetical protein
MLKGFEMNAEAFEELSAMVECLRDDAAQMREENEEDERAENMVKAADALERFHKAAAELLIHCEASEDACYGTLGIRYVREVLADALPVTETQKIRGAIGEVVARVVHASSGAPTRD